jgi:hypothetical protein
LKLLSPRGGLKKFSKRMPFSLFCKEFATIQKLYREGSRAQRFEKPFLDCIAPDLPHNMGLTLRSGASLRLDAVETYSPNPKRQRSNRESLNSEAQAR